MYGAQLAALYDAVYQSRGKDYAEEAKYLSDTVRGRVPGASSLLDVGCGTGAHLEHFGDLFDHVEGLELSAEMLEAARRRLPATALHQGDMRSFDLGRKFDVVFCLFGSVGHVADRAELRGTFDRFARHLTPGGIVVVEPWWFAESYLDGYVSGDVVTPDHRTIARVSHTRREGDGSRMEVHYVVADPEGGVTSFTEEYTHRLFTRAEYTEELRAAGLTVDYLAGVQGGRGLFLATPEGR
ncbi:class I SAM-dependent methyltransferase [Streptomyces profundus]|uniref:class I SAM-dependent methyltransferase n=1 Tax=Streptomyces profundus TaxID=2867410 RepID=UPI001D167A2D|nr:class I SAM-dependent methyltransferase [Streptomyces sp. MA3_2.13]UED83233.1 class I SAM-dependent methyltransferase [Streptomyces sp. MA3_2.13]